MKSYEIIRPATHQDWLNERTKGVGASEVGVIFGVSKYKTPYQLWREKVGLDIKQEEENWAMIQGHLMEIHLRSEFEKQTGLKTIAASQGDWLAVDKAHPFLRVSPDVTYWLEGMPHNHYNKGVLECKSSRLDITIDTWRSEHVDWFLQIQYQQYVMRLKDAWLGFVNTLTGETFFDCVPLNNEFVLSDLIPAIDEFWNKNVLPAREFLSKIEGEPMPGQIEELHQYAPPAQNSDDVVLRFPKPFEGKTIESKDINTIFTATDYGVGEDSMMATVFADDLGLYKMFERKKKEYEALIEKFKDGLKLQMKDNEAILSEDMKALVTWKNNKDARKFNEKKFAEENPELYAKYLENKTGARVLKIK